MVQLSLSILPGIEIVDLGLLIDKETFIFSDTQIGYEESLNKQGMMVPRIQSKELKDRIIAMLDIAQPKCLIINGDVKHEFGTISNQEWRDILALLDLFQGRGITPKIVRGNHDTILEPILKKRNIEMRDHFTLRNGEIYCCHGHVIPKDDAYKKAKIIIIGHEHPAVSLKDTIRAETYKCFLVGKYKRKTLIVLPSCNLAIEGTNVLQEKLLSPFLHQNLDDFDAYVIADRTYHFGKLKNLT